MKCESCRKENKELTTWWERLKYEVMKRLFSKDLVDFNQEKYMQGFGDGYKTGLKHAQVANRESKDLVERLLDGDESIIEELNKGMTYEEYKKNN